MTRGEPEDPSNKSEAVLSVLNRVRISKMSQSATAPDRIRMKVNVAASIVVCLSASRQSKELLANAIIASDVSMKSRVDFIAHSTSQGAMFICADVSHGVSRVADMLRGDR